MIAQMISVESLAKGFGCGSFIVLGHTEMKNFLLNSRFLSVLCYCMIRGMEMQP
jgi:hypothetical protein